MTATAAPPAPVPAKTAPVRRRRRWHRIVIPFALATVLVTVTLLTHAADQPDAGDRGFLSPVATGDDGGSRLAEALRGQGVTVQRETDTLRALLALDGRPATLFVPAPELLHPDTVGALGDLPAGSRLVLVDPSRRVLESVDLPVAPTDRRWAARAVDPEADGRPCPLPEADRAGTAAVRLQGYAAAGGYAGDLRRCYSGGLVHLPWAADVVVIGASDPFRNDRIGEWGNEALSTGLLGVRGRVVWLDLDGPAPPPHFGTGSSGPPAWSPAPGGSTTWGDGSGTGDGGPAGGGPGGPGDGGDSDEQDRADGPQPEENPLWSAFPPWFWALLLQLALAALLVVLWRARRLGPPVGEPLPVQVRAAETVLGRARLYQQARARGPAAGTLRAATLDRLLTRLNLPATTPPAEVAAFVAARAGGTADEVHELLYGAEPSTDAELLALARSLDRVTRTVTAAPDHPTEGDPR
ncbi:DUF4350 domain-containing protein [Micromonospora halophytica]|uniref:DUF4350 domain-containing protein n=1 Tax=Micromonospora halophytica TaxID=47864 RepID=A0A1C5HAE2_9ACTN|nr:DUF4350 domain-containing protein [Micromonospora halophytica]SCG42847.1 Domain of unknown function [Micromonospora halophytica]